MSKAPKYVSIVKGGHLNDSCRKAILTCLKSFEGKVVEITITVKKKIRSIRQNKYYWGYVIPPIVVFFNDYGNNLSEEQVHEFLKSEVGKLDRILVLPNDKTARIPGTTTDLSTVEFEDYLTKIRAWCAEFGCVIPLPGEIEY